MKAYIISLENPIKKIKYLNSYGISIEWIKGVNGQAIENENSIPKGAMGCALSHIKTWKTFMNTDDEYAIILEDDVVLEDNFLENVNNALMHVPQDYDVLYLGCFGCDPDDVHNFFKLTEFMYGKNKRAAFINEYISIPEFAYATHAYILSRNGAKKLLKLFDKINNHIDIMLHTFASKNIINTYVTTPRLAYQTSTDTGISENIKTKHPSIVIDMLRNYEIDKMFRGDYIATVSYKQVGPYCINLISFSFLLIGIICKLCKLPIRYLTIFYVILSLPDFQYKKNLITIIVNYFIMILPYLILGK